MDRRSARARRGVWTWRCDVNGIVHVSTPVTPFQHHAHHSNYCLAITLDMR